MSQNWFSSQKGDMDLSFYVNLVSGFKHVPGLSIQGNTTNACLVAPGHSLTACNAAPPATPHRPHNPTFGYWTHRSTFAK